MRFSHVYSYQVQTKKSSSSKASEGGSSGSAINFGPLTVETFKKAPLNNKEASDTGCVANSQVVVAPASGDKDVGDPQGVEEPDTASSGDTHIKETANVAVGRSTLGEGGVAGESKLLNKAKEVGVGLARVEEGEAGPAVGLCEGCGGVPGQGPKSKAWHCSCQDPLVDEDEEPVVKPVACRATRQQTADAQVASELNAHAFDGLEESFTDDMVALCKASLKSIRLAALRDEFAFLFE